MNTFNATLVLEHIDYTVHTFPVVNIKLSTYKNPYVSKIENMRAQIEVSITGNDEFVKSLVEDFPLGKSFNSKVFIHTDDEVLVESYEAPDISLFSYDLRMGRIVFATEYFTRTKPRSSKDEIVTYITGLVRKKAVDLGDAVVWFKDDKLVSLAFNKEEHHPALSIFLNGNKVSETSLNNYGLIDDLTPIDNFLGEL